MQPKNPVDGGVATVAGILAIVAVLALWQTREFSSLGSLFPIAIGACLLVSSLVVLWRAWRGRGRKDRSLTRDGAWRSGVLIGTMFVWIAALETVGFAVTSVVAFLVLAAAADRERLTWRRAVLYAAISLVLVFAFHFLFVDVLKVQLPRGTLGLM